MEIFHLPQKIAIAIPQRCHHEKKHKKCMEPHKKIQCYPYDCYLCSLHPLAFRLTTAAHSTFYQTIISKIKETKVIIINLHMKLCMIYEYLHLQVVKTQFTIMVMSAQHKCCCLNELLFLFNQLSVKFDSLLLGYLPCYSWGCT